MTGEGDESAETYLNKYVFSMLDGVNQLLEEGSTAPEFPTFLIKTFDESNDSVIGQCLIITQNIGPDTTAANCLSVNFCQR